MGYLHSFKNDIKLGGDKVNLGEFRKEWGMNIIRIHCISLCKILRELIKNIKDNAYAKQGKNSSGLGLKSLCAFNISLYCIISGPIEKGNSVSKVPVSQTALYTRQKSVLTGKATLVSLQAECAGCPKAGKWSYMAEWRI